MKKTSLLACLLLGFAAAFAQADAPLFRFGAIADVQYCDCDPGPTRFYRDSPQKLEAALADLAGEEPAFIVHLGDVIDKDFDSYAEIMPYFEKAQAPLHFVLGNHEFSVADSLKAQEPGLLGRARRYDDFSVKGWRFVLTDGNENSLFAWPAGSRPYRKAQRALAQYSENQAPQAQAWNGGMSSRQVKWLRKVLMHNLWNDAEVVALLEASPHVVAWMSGHNHAGGYTLQNGIHYLILHGMVETPDTTAYAVVDVYADRLVVRGRGREPLRVMQLK